MYDIVNKAMCDIDKNTRNWIEKVYRQGYEDGQKEKLANAMIYDHEVAEKTAYEQGLNEAWEVAGKLFKVPNDALMELFEMKSPYFDFSAQEVLNKIKEYENKQEQDAEIEVGDEVVSDYKAKGVVVGIDTHKGEVMLSLLMKNHKVPQLVRASRFKTKTGRHFPQIAKVLAELRGAE